jgi:hypothetical protein
LRRLFRPDKKIIKEVVIHPIKFSSETTLQILLKDEIDRGTAENETPPLLFFHTFLLYL